MFIGVIQDHSPLPDYITPAPCATRGNGMKFVHPATSVNLYKYNFFPAQPVNGTNYQKKSSIQPVCITSEYF